MTDGDKYSIPTVLTFIEGLDVALFDEAPTHEIVTQAGTPKEKRFTGQSCLFNYGLPHFFSHTTTAYSILRLIPYRATTAWKSAKWTTSVPIERIEQAGDHFVCQKGFRRTIREHMKLLKR